MKVKNGKKNVNGFIYGKIQKFFKWIFSFFKRRSKSNFSPGNILPGHVPTPYIITNKPVYTKTDISKRLRKKINEQQKNGWEYPKFIPYDKWHGYLNGLTTYRKNGSKF